MINNNGMKMRGLMEDKKGNLMQLPVNLLILFISVTFLVALIPAFVEMQNTAQQSDNLNCVGYKHGGDVGATLSYNATLGTNSSIACMAIKLYLPYIVLGVMIAGVAFILYGRPAMGDGGGAGYG